MRARDCMAPGCGASMRGSDLARHYRLKTDFKKIVAVKKLSPSEAETELKAMDVHTAFMFKSGYHSSDKSPHWNIHKPTKQAKQIPTFFQKKKVDPNMNEESVETEELAEEVEKVIEVVDVNEVEEVSEVEDETGLSEEEKLEDPKVGASEDLEDQDEGNEVLKAQITEQIEAAKNGSWTEEDIEKLADKIAYKSALKTLEMLKLEREEIQNENMTIEETWIDGETVIICRPCLKFSAKEDVPTKFSRSRKGNFGMVDKRNPDGKPRLKKHINQSIKEHGIKDLHIYCCAREKEAETIKVDYENNNKAAGRVVIRNIIKTLKRGGSSVDFQADNNLFHLESNYQDIVVATKNDSSDAFFKVRDVVFDVVSEKVKDWFRQRGEGEVEEVAVTLDKVTVQRTSYTVLLTYFFRDGVIYILLNKLMVMNVDEYDSEGTARAVVDALVGTLGISRARLSDILLHFAYDGVYATKGETC